MRHIAAYLLLQIGGNASPSAKDVKKVLSAVGIEADDERLDKLISELEGKNVDEVSFSSLMLFSVTHLIAPVNRRWGLEARLGAYCFCSLPSVNLFWWFCRFHPVVVEVVL